MAWVPELAVQSTFISAGMHFGSILHMPFIKKYDALQSLQAWPLVAAVASAGVTAVLLYVLKRKQKREMFGQPALLIGAVICLLLSGVSFHYPDYKFYLVAGVFLAAIGHGIIYIAALSFLNNRVSSRCRSSRLALAHFWYQFGYAVGAQLLEQPHWKRDFATAMTYATAVNLILLLTNELFQYFQVYDYKCSLDETFDIVNKKGLLLLDRKEIVDSLRANHMEYPEGYALLVTEEKLSWKLAPLLLLLKVQSFMAFALPLKIIILLKSAEQYNFWMVEWIKTVGVVVFVLMSVFISARKLHMVFNAIQMVCLIAAMCVISDTNHAFVAPVLMYYAFLGVIYPIGDICVLDTTKFSRMEVSLFIGFAIEKLLVAFFVFAYYADPTIILADNVYASFYAYGSSFVVYSALMFLLVLMVYFNTIGLSLYTIRKSMLGIQMVRRDEQPISVVVVPALVNRNSPTADKRRREVLMRNLSRSSTPPPAATSTISSAGPVFVGGPNNRYDRDLNRMSPASVIPRALIGGAIFSSFSFNM